MGKDLLKKVDWPAPGRYILAVSGGVDSVCLMDIMTKASPGHEYELIVAHFDHGMRPDSASDAEFVKSLARQYHLEFIVDQGKLHKDNSEAQAREARYQFLESAKRQRAADAILTAHHFDDALETAIFNAGRGASDDGLTPMSVAISPVRPFLQLRKAELAVYAKTHNLTWREDSTNQDLSLARNFIRHRIVPLLSQKEIKALEVLAENNKNRQVEAEKLADSYEIAGKFRLPREDFATLSSDHAVLLTKFVLRKIGVSLENQRLLALVNFVKVGSTGAQFQGSGKLRAHIRNDMITLAKNRS